jgi:hypothetical protein
MSERRTTARGFELVIERDEDRTDGRYALALNQTNGLPANTRQVGHIPADRLDVARPALTDALRASGHATATLGPTRKKPVILTEDAGVRAALAVNVIAGVSKPGRTSRLLDGISRLSDEECFYWYAHTIGERDPAVARRRLKALRIFLAQE